MWPWGHLAFGLLLYLVFVSLRKERTIPPSVVFALAFGTQFPDVVDKPLAWSLGVLPNGRSLAHSIFTFALVAVILYYVARRYDRTAGATAFCFGYLSHIVGDVLSPLLDGELYYASFFLWPLVPAIDYGPEVGFAERLAGVELTLSLGIQVGLVVLGTLWYLLCLSGWRDAVGE